MLFHGGTVKKIDVHENQDRRCLSLPVKVNIFPIYTYLSTVKKKLTHPSQRILVLFVHCSLHSVCEQYQGLYLIPRFLPVPGSL